MTPIDKQLSPPGGWHACEQPRIAPLKQAELSAPLRALLWGAGKWAHKRTGSSTVPDVFLLLLRHPKLFKPWLRFASVLMPYGSLDRRDAELVILRVAWRCRCRYEWGQHVEIGLRAGLAATDIARVSHGPQAEGWSALQAGLIQAVDDMHEQRQISADCWAGLQTQYSPAQMIELTMLIGHYEMLAGLLNSVGLPLEAHAEAHLAAAPIHAGVA